MVRKIATLALGAFVVVACGSETPPSQFGSSGNPDQDAGSASGTFGEGGAKPPPPVECKKMDIVFIVDNSPSMKEEQDNLGANFPKFIDIINSYKTEAGDLLDYRVAITTTDDNGKQPDSGKFRKVRGTGSVTCNPGPNNDPWLTRADTDIASHFACRAAVGVDGSPLERPLECARLSVTDRITDGKNAMQDGTPFLREDALLAFVIITDEDEGSADGSVDAPPAPLKDAGLYAADFDNVKSGLRGRWAASVIAGDRGCESALGKAADAVRLKKFITTAGPKNGVFSSICDGDLTKGLQDALKLFTAACKEFPGVVK